MYHDIRWARADTAAAISIEGGALTVTEGPWPGCAVPVIGCGDCALDPADAYIYLDHDGSIVMSSVELQFLPIKTHELTMLDLLAWYEAEEWHVKRLVSNA